MTAWQRLQQSVLTTSQVRDVDQRAVREYAMHSLVLMENAALGCVHWLLENRPAASRTVLLCGRGNNGGDGLAIARHLVLHGWPCHVLLQGPADQLSADNRSNLEILNAGQSPPDDLLSLQVCQAGDASPTEFSQADVIIDAMLGTGASGDPRPPFADWIRAANRSKAFRIAIDVPTGINAEDGTTGSPYFHADATLTFVAKKPAMVMPESQSQFGQIEVLPIGIPDRLIRELLEAKARC